MAWFVVMVVVVSDNGLGWWCPVAVTCWSVDCSFVGGWGRVGFMRLYLVGVCAAE